jgi:hypothetical protein
VHRLGYGPFSRCTTDAAGPRRRLCLTALEAVALACEAVGMARRACPVPCSCSGRTTCCARSCCPALEAARFARKAVGMARRARPVPSTNLRCVQQKRHVPMSAGGISSVSGRQWTRCDPLDSSCDHSFWCHIHTTQDITGLRHHDSWACATRVPTLYRTSSSPPGPRSLMPAGGGRGRLRLAPSSLSLLSPSASPSSSPRARLIPRSSGREDASAADAVNVSPDDSALNDCSSADVGIAAIGPRQSTHYGRRCSRTGTIDRSTTAPRCDDNHCSADQQQLAVAAHSWQRPRPTQCSTADQAHVQVTYGNVAGHMCRPHVHCHSSCV